MAGIVKLWSRRFAPPASLLAFCHSLLAHLLRPGKSVGSIGKLVLCGTAYIYEHSIVPGFLKRN